jgi:hypothetical protein
MRVLLHIGQSKTGTSAIQAFLTLNRGILRKHGILYPSIKIKGMPLNLGAHNAVSDALLNHHRFPFVSAADYFQQFFNDATESKSDLLILSAEHFFGGEPRVWSVQNEEEYFQFYREKVEKLAVFLQGHEVKILVYLRPQLDWLSSAIAQTVRIERLISDRLIYNNDRQFFELIKPLLKYADLLDIWRDIIKPSSFMVVPYIRSALHKNSSVADFLMRTGLDHISFQYATTDIQVNESLNYEFIEVKKRLNHTNRSKNEERTIIRCLENLSRANPGSSKYIINPEIIKDVNEFIGSHNERVNRCFMSDGFMLPTSTEKCSPQNPLTEMQIGEAMQLFYTEYSKLKYRILLFSFLLRAMLRVHASTLHAALHQFKVLYWAVKYKR